MDRDTEKAFALMVWFVLMGAVIIACTLPVWTK